MPLVIHGHANVTPPSITVLVFSINDTRTRMDRLEQRFRQIRIFDGDTSWDDINVCAPHSPIAQIHDIDV